MQRCAIGVLLAWGCGGPEPVDELCGSGADEDLDGYADCDDLDCFEAEVCGCAGIPQQLLDDPPPQDNTTPPSLRLDRLRAGVRVDAVPVTGPVVVDAVGLVDATLRRGDDPVEVEVFRWFSGMALQPLAPLVAGQELALDVVWADGRICETRSVPVSDVGRALAAVEAGVTYEVDAASGRWLLPLGLHSLLVEQLKEVYVAVREVGDDRLGLEIGDGEYGVQNACVPTIALTDVPFDGARFAVGPLADPVVFEDEWFGTIRFEQFQAQGVFDAEANRLEGIQIRARVDVRGFTIAPEDSCGVVGALGGEGCVACADGEVACVESWLVHTPATRDTLLGADGTVGLTSIADPCAEYPDDCACPAP